jgi:hypothetical protein
MTIKFENVNHGMCYTILLLNIAVGGNLEERQESLMYGTMEVDYGQ